MFFYGDCRNIKSDHKSRDVGIVMSTGKKLINGVLWTFTGTGVQVILQFLVFIVLSRSLEPENLGVMSTALALITVLSTFSKLGIGPSIVQREEIEIKHVQTGFTVSLIFSTILTTIVWFASPFISSFFNMPELGAVLQVLAFIHLIQGFSIIAEALLQSNLKFKKLAFVQVISYLAYGIVGITLSLFGFGVWSLVFAQITHVSLKTLLYLKVQPHSKRIVIEYDIAKELLVFGSGYSIGIINNHLALQADTFVVGKFLGASSLGIYSRAYQLLAMPVNLVGTVIEKVLFPSFSRIGNDITKLQEVYKASITVTAVICLPLSFFLMILSENIILLLFGSMWTDAIVPFAILILALLPRVSYKISDSLTKSLGKVFQSANRQFIYGVCVVLGVLIGQLYGLKGAAIGVVVAITINYIFMAQIALSLSSLTWKDFLIAHLPALNLTIASVTPTYVVYFIIERLSL